MTKNYYIIGGGPLGMSFALNASLKNKKVYVIESGSELGGLAAPFKFSGDLNKTSLKNINKKNISNLEKIIGNKTIEELLLLSKLTNNMVSLKQSNKIIKILKEYKEDFDIKDLELCLKIDKTIEFITLSAKDKKEINNICEINN
jgi:thioredoxin reductase